MGKVEQLRALRENKWQARETPRVVKVPKEVPSDAKPEERQAPAAVIDSAEGTASGKERTWSPGLSIHQYSDEQLTEVISEVLSSGVSDPDEVLHQVMALLGFVRKGKVIRKRVSDVQSRMSEVDKAS